MTRQAATLKAGGLLALLLAAGPVRGDEWTPPDWRSLENQSVIVEPEPVDVSGASSVPGTDAFLAAVAGAMDGKWAYSNVYGKCLQYSGDVVHRASGDPAKLKKSPNP